MAATIEEFLGHRLDELAAMSDADIAVEMHPILTRQAEVLATIPKRKLVPSGMSLTGGPGLRQMPKAVSKPSGKQSMLELLAAQQREMAKMVEEKMKSFNVTKT